MSYGMRIGSVLFGGPDRWVRSRSSRLPRHDAALRVCADPGNMPFSNDGGEGLENKIGPYLRARSAPKFSITTGRRSSAA